MNHFSVVSYGYSASRWLAYALSLNPDAFVSHGTYEINSLYLCSDEKERENEKSGERLDPLTRGRADLALKSLTIDALYQKYKQYAPNKLAYGNVHTYVPRELFYKENWQALGLNIFHLTRHPIDFLQSHTAGVIQAEQVSELHQHYSQFFELFKSRFPHVIQQPWFDETHSHQRAFILSCYTLFNLAQDLRRYGGFMKSIKMEELTQSPLHLHSTCEALTGLEYSINELTTWSNKGKLNQHQVGKTSNRELSTEQITILQTIISEELYSHLASLNYPLPKLTHYYPEYD